MTRDERWTNAKEVEARLPAMAAGIAAILPHGPWYAKKAGETWYTIGRYDGAALSLSLHNYPKVELTVRGEFPKAVSASGGYTSDDYGPWPHDGRPKARVNPARSVEAITKDITRRVLTPYLSLFAAAAERKAKTEDGGRYARNAAEILAGVLGVKAAPERNGYREAMPPDGWVGTWTATRYGSGDTPGVYVTVRAGEDARRVSVKLDNLTPAEAVMLLEAIKEREALAA